MDYRIKAFKEKFESAQELLGGESSRDIVSIKFRAGCANHHEYSEYFDYLNHDLMLKVTPANGKFQGNASLIADNNNNKIIAVEHETGLEILFVVGSIASLISLIPTAINGWRFLKDRFFNRSNRFSNGSKSDIEVRSFNEKNILIEQPIINIENYIFNLGHKKVTKLFEENNKLKVEIISLRKRLNEIKIPKRKKLRHR